MWIRKKGEIFPFTLNAYLGDGILPVTPGQQFAGEEYCPALTDIRLPNSRHVEVVVLLTKHI